MNARDASDPPIACTLSAHELTCGAADLLPGLADAADSVRLQPDGVRLEFLAREGVVSRIAAVIERERQCCQFLHFRLDVTPSLGALILEIDGPPGTAEFLGSLHASLGPRGAEPPAG